MDTKMGSTLNIWHGRYTTMKIEGKVITGLYKLSTMLWRRVRKWRDSSSILNLLGNRRRYVVSFKPLPLYPRYPLDRRPGRSQIRFGSYEEKKNLLSLLGIEPRLVVRSACSLVAIPTELQRNKVIRFIFTSRVTQIFTEVGAAYDNFQKFASRKHKWIG
jgi:hypothetical protein